MKRHDLEAMIDEGLKGGTDDIHAWCDELVADLPEDELRCVLGIVMPSFVNGHVSRRRMTLLSAVQPCDEAADDEPQVEPEPVVGRSRRARASRLARQLGALIAVSDHGRKPLGECSRADIEAQAEKLRDHIRANSRRLETYEALAKAMADAGVDRVGDLDAATLHNILGGAA